MPEEPKKPEKEEKKEEKPTPVDNLIESKHTLTIDGKELKYTVVTGTMVLKEETADREKEAEGEKPKAQVFFTAYTKDGVRNKIQASYHVFVQRRSGLILGLDAPGDARSAPGGDDFRRRPAAAALPVDRQRVLAAGRDRPGVHRPGQHGLQPPGGGPEAQGVARLQEGHPVGGRFHPPVHHALRALALAQVPDRRELRHHARRRACRATCRSATACT